MTEEKYEFIDERFKKAKSDFYFHSFAKDLSVIIFMNKDHSNREWGQIEIYDELIQYKICLSFLNLKRPLVDVFCRIPYNDNFYIPNSIGDLFLFIYKSKNTEFKFC